MAKMIFVNLPVGNVARSTAFYEAIGGTLNPQFSNADSAAMSFSETITLMLLNHGKFGGFTPRPIADARAATEVLIAFSQDSRASVDTSIDAGIAAGGKGDPSPVQEHGFMYGRSVEDPDGHIIEIFWLDIAAMNAAMAAAPPAAKGEQG